MTPPGFESGARAAGAIAFAADMDEDRICFDGAIERFGLTSAHMRWQDFYARLGPVDRANLLRAAEGGQIDLRIRLIGDEGGVVYVRVLGCRTQPGQFEGLMTPAGLIGADAGGRIAEEHALADGLDAGEVLAWYQPIIALSNGRLAGFEALARWERPDIGVIGPDDFLDMADDLDLLGRIGHVVRSSAIADLAAWRTATPAAADLFVAANATVSELVASTFAEELLDDVSGAQLPPGRFKLEIAETEIMREPDRAAAAMARLSDGGVALALDDFGTGYSSLARLDMLPFDVVKIDRYFVRALASDENAGRVVESVIQLAAHFSMKVVAEGVEDQLTADRLREMGCDFAQGFRYAGAMSPVHAADVVLNGIAGRFQAALAT